MPVMHTPRVSPNRTDPNTTLVLTWRSGTSQGPRDPSSKSWSNFLWDKVGPDLLETPSCSSFRNDPQFFDSCYFPRNLSLPPTPDPPLKRVIFQNEKYPFFASVCRVLGFRRHLPAKIPLLKHFRGTNPDPCLKILLK